MRDHRKLKAFQLADELVLDIYRLTRSFPAEERFGLSSQLRRAAVSIASNIVEGCARAGEAEYLHFLYMAYGSAKEVSYQLSLAYRLHLITEKAGRELEEQTTVLAKTLNALITGIKRSKPKTQSLKPKA
jgi:four helix bundle protein